MADPDRIVAAAKAGGSVIRWRLDPRDREVLLRRFPPKYAQTVADHVTLAAKVAASTPLPPKMSAHVTGYVDDGRGVEALVVSVDGSSDRPDGSIYHSTWSLEPGRRAKESNEVLKKHGWQALDEPIPLTLVPARLR